MQRYRLRAVLALAGGLGIALSCTTREVSVAAEKGGACDYGATPEGDARVCADGYSCEPIQGGTGEYVCAVPVIIRGHVFDALSGAPLEGALITALDNTSAPVSDVAVSDAAGAYELEVVALRDSDGEISDDAIYTLQAFAADYAPFPFGVRPALPVSTADGVVETVPGEDADGDGEPDDVERLVLETPTTEVALIPLADAGGGTIHGSILEADGAQLPAGTLVIAEGAGTPAPYGLADRSGEFTIFNVPPGTVSVAGYRTGIELAPVSVDVAAGTTHEVELTIAASGDALASVSGSASIVNAPGGSATSVVLVPSSVYNEPLERGPVPYGLRAPGPGIAPDVNGAFTISQVPAGTYKVLAAFENDDLVRDPDITIAGTQIQEITVASGEAATVEENFKVTEALAVVRPGSEEPEGVSGAPTFEFADDSSEDRYIVVVYDALGDLVWEKTDIPGVSGSPTVEVPYEGPALISGMWYQFWATSVRDKKDEETRISRTEDLRGVFFAE